MRLMSLLSDFDDYENPYKQEFLKQLENKSYQIFKGREKFKDSDQNGVNKSGFSDSDLEDQQEQYQEDMKYIIKLVQENKKLDPIHIQHLQELGIDIERKDNKVFRSYILHE